MEPTELTNAVFLVGSILLYAIFDPHSAEGIISTPDQPAQFLMLALQFYYHHKTQISLI